jgi:hypothetical protein
MHICADQQSFTIDASMMQAGDKRRQIRIGIASRYQEALFLSRDSLLLKLRCFVTHEIKAEDLLAQFVEQNIKRELNQKT